MPALEDAFGDIFYKARYGLGLSVDEVAAATGIAVSRLSAFESYESRPTRPEVETLASALDLGTEALWDSAQEAWVPDNLDARLSASVQLQRIVFPAMNANGYIIADPDRNGMLAIDPGGPADEWMRRCQNADLPLLGCLITHAHGDHVGALPQVLQAHPQLPIVLHSGAARKLSLRGRNITVVDEDTTLHLGPFRVEVLLTPGHSPDGLTFCVEDLVFVGDTLFAGSLGRSQKGHQTYAQLLASAQRIVDLPATTMLLPGHGPPTTVAAERIHNPFLSYHLRTRASSMTEGSPS